MRDAVQGASARSLRHDQYTVGWICALPIELAASRAMLDGEHEDLCKISHDPNEYVLGNIGTHNIVMTCLPTGQYGTNNAAIAASNMLRSFRSVRMRLMVGIGGGVPSNTVDIRLGDVVVGTRITQYDMGKIVSQEQLQRTAIPKTPPHLLLNAVSKLRALHESTPSKVSTILNDILSSQPNMTEYSYPSLCKDWLFQHTYDHDQPEDCRHCDSSKLILRSSRQTNVPKIHYGGIASGNQVVKYARTRNIVAKELDVICFEMEAAGLMDHFPCIPIRGICDYADSHKNKRWQKYAAAAAAAYAKELLLSVAPNEGERAATAVVTSNISASVSRDGKYITFNRCSMQLINLTVHISASVRREELLGLLRFEQINSRYTSIKVADKKTCEWLLDHGVYKSWLKPTDLPQHHGFLWIRGKPGAGKSTLMKFALGRAKRSTLADAATASFFFHARGEELERSTVGMYRSLLLQLLERFPDLQSTLDSIPETSAVGLGIDVLKETFQMAVLALKHRKFTCYIDALDECDEGQILDMVQHFEDLGDKAATDQINLRICFASRHYPHIDIERGLKLTVEDQQGHAEDLKKYVHGHLLNIGSKTYTEDIQKKLFEKAEGVFIWIVLVIEILNKEIRNGRAFATEKRLQEIPSRLSELFRDILLRNGSNSDDLLLCILWILYAKRPLKRQEFYFAVLSGLPDDSLVPYNRDQFTTEVMERYIVSSSKGLAEITKTHEGVVQFIHESVREFFIKDRGLQDIWPTPGKDFEAFGHDMLKKCCFSQMMLGITRAIPNVSCMPKAHGSQMMELRHTLSKTYPFLPYAIKHVLHHANAAASGIPQTDFLHSFPLKTWIPVNNILERYETDMDRYTIHANLPYVLAHGKFDKLLVSQIQGTADNYISIAEYINHRSPLDLTKGQSPIFWAIENGHYSIAVYLISTNRFDLNERDSDLRTPLHLAAIRGDVQILQDLLNRGIDIEACCSGGKVALSYAVHFGWKSAVQLLIERGACVDVRDEMLRTPLHLAVNGGHEAIVRLLIQEKADINAQDNRLETPLHIATERGHEAVVRMLIHEKTDMNPRNDRSWTPLHIAADRGHEGIVRMLIQEKADIDAPADLNGWTPLHIAADKGHEATVRALVHGRANIDARNFQYTTPMSLASARKHEHVVKFLREAGAVMDQFFSG